MRPIVIAGGVAVLGLVLAGGRKLSGGSSTTLVWSGGSYRVTPGDRLWLLRAVQAESNKPDDRKRVAMMRKRTAPLVLYGIR